MSYDPAKIFNKMSKQKTKKRANDIAEQGQTIDSTHAQNMDYYKKYLAENAMNAMAAEEMMNAFGAGPQGPMMYNLGGPTDMTKYGFNNQNPALTALLSRKNTLSNQNQIAAKNMSDAFVNMDLSKKLKMHTEIRPEFRDEYRKLNRQYKRNMRNIPTFNPGGPFKGPLTAQSYSDWYKDRFSNPEQYRYVTPVDNTYMAKDPEPTIDEQYQQYLFDEAFALDGELAPYEKKGERLLSKEEFISRRRDEQMKAYEEQRKAQLNGGKKSSGSSGASGGKRKSTGTGTGSDGKSILEMADESINDKTNNESERRGNVSLEDAGYAASNAAGNAAGTNNTGAEGASAAGTGAVEKRPQIAALYPSTGFMGGRGSLPLFYNPENTYLEDVSFRRGLFGGPKVKKMHFTHYRDNMPGMPGLPNNVAAENAFDPSSMSAEDIAKFKDYFNFSESASEPETSSAEKTALNTTPSSNIENRGAYQGTSSGTSPMTSTHGQMDMVEDINNQVNEYLQNNPEKMTPQQWMENNPGVVDALSKMQMKFGGIAAKRVRNKINNIVGPFGKARFGMEIPYYPEMNDGGEMVAGWDQVREGVSSVGGPMVSGFHNIGKGFENMGVPRQFTDPAGAMMEKGQMNNFMNMLPGKKYGGRHLNKYFVGGSFNFNERTGEYMDNMISESENKEPADAGQTAFADTYVKNQRDWGKIAKQGVGPALDFAAMVGRSMTEPDYDQQIMDMTAAENMFTPSDDVERGMNTFNAMGVVDPYGVKMAPQFTGMMGKYGGTFPKYEMGGTYDLTEDQIKQIIAMGGEIEYID